MRKSSEDGAGSWVVGGRLARICCFVVLSMVPAGGVMACVVGRKRRRREDERKRRVREEKRLLLLIWVLKLSILFVNYHRDVMGMVYIGMSTCGFGATSFKMAYWSRR